MFTASADGPCDALAGQLWELHTTAARLCHFLANCGSPVLPGWREVSPSTCWGNLLAGLGVLYDLARILMHTRVDVLGGPNQRDTGPAR